MSVNSDLSTQRLHQEATFAPSHCGTSCIQAVLTIFRQLAHWAQQAFQSLTSWAWKLLNQESSQASSQERGSQTIEIAKRTAPQELFFGENQRLPVDIFLGKLLPYLSAKDLSQLFLTHTDYLKFLKNPAVLNQLFSSPDIDYLKFASLMEDEDWKKVTQLNLCKSRLTEQEILTLMRKLPKLQSLDLSRCPMTSTSILEIVQDLPNLIHLDLSSSKIKDADLQRLTESKPNLTSLNVLSCLSLTDAGILAMIQNCPHLASFKCHVPDADSIALEMAQKCKKLTCLHLGGFNLTNKGVTALAENCPDLTSLSLTSHLINVAGGASLSSLAGHCSKLVHLVLGEFQITHEELFQIIQNNPMLESLHLLRCKQTDQKAFQELSQDCPNLVHIDLQDCWDLSEETIQALVKRCPNLRSIRLYPCKALTDETLVVLAKHCPNLKNISLDYGEKITDTGLQALAEGCPLLTSLSISHCEKLMGRAFQALAGKRLNLKELTIRGCTNIANEGIQAIANACPHLEKVQLSNFKQVTNLVMQELFKGCKDLKKLVLEDCSLITSSAIEALAENCPNLQSLNIYKCGNIEDAAFQALAEGCRHLTSISLTNVDIKDTGIKALAESCQSLSNIYLDCSDITDEGILSLANSCPKLKDLALRGLKTINGSSLLQVAAKCLKLQKISLGQGMGIPCDVLEKLRHLYPKLNICMY